jgi:dolichol-phosphate mannosyltransferase
MKALVMVPTFNERAVIGAMLDALLALPVPGLEVLVVDDESTDGTQDIVRAKKSERVHLLSRPGPRGRGLAGRAGYQWALDHGFDCLLEMDADFSHQPRYVPALVDAMGRCDFAIGSRFVPGGTDDDRVLARRLLTKVANFYARTLLSLPVMDTNSGFRCLSRKALLAVDPATLKSSGPSILHETLWRAARAGLEISELPIEFVDRKQGRSKLSLLKLVDGYLWILRLRVLA